ncbi:MAG: TIR domain-containing protein [Phycisphaerales bacterium]
MPTSVFISHGGADTQTARRVADELRKHGLVVALDREQLRQGDVFLRFMEKALSDCTYCLLLWSQAAAKGKWVAIEWEAALYRAVEEARSFLLIGCLDAEPLPALLAPRLRASLSPDLYPGLTELLDLARRDAVAEGESNRPVAKARVPLTQDDSGTTIYVTSELFGITQPLRVDLTIPAGVHLDRLVADLRLPMQHDHQGIMGVTYEYRFAHDETPIARNKSLAAQGIGQDAVLWLEVEMKPFARHVPVAGQLAGATFRGPDAGAGAAFQSLLDAVNAAGLGAP